MKLTKLAVYAWAVLLVNLGVILWGAYVRATGSGAGCGSHWPLCNGEVLPRAPQIETIIEFAHRLSSGAAFLLVVILLVWVLRSTPKRHPTRLGASLAMFFMVTEALVGAALVLFEWVAHDASLGRVISISIHLVNTFLLLACLALTAWWASGGDPIKLSQQGMITMVLAIGIAGMLILGVSGAITALGDTLFPSGSLTEGLSQDFAPTAHFLIRLRVWHPLIAISTGFYIIFISILISFLRSYSLPRKLAIGLCLLIVLQWAAGLVNVILLAPVPMQLIHLLLADLVWILLVLFSATVLAEREVVSQAEAVRLDQGSQAI